MSKHYEILANDVCRGIYTVTANTEDEAIDKIMKKQWDKYEFEALCSTSDTFGFGVVNVWRDPEPEDNRKDRYDNCLNDVMEDSSDETV